MTVMEQRLDITKGMNGYPQNVREAITADTVTELKEMHNQHVRNGHDVKYVELFKKNGWGLWNYSEILTIGESFQIVGEQDWAIKVEKSFTPTQTAQQIVCGGMSEDEITDPHRKLVSEVASDIEMMLPVNEDWESATIFYDPEQEYEIDYIITDETIGYSYDNKNYQYGIIVD